MFQILNTDLYISIKEKSFRITRIYEKNNKKL